MHTQYMYTQNKYNTAICKYTTVALGAAANTVLLVWPQTWFHDSILFYLSGQGTVHRVTISWRSFREWTRRIPRRQCSWRSFGHHDGWRFVFYSNSHQFNVPRCQLLTCNSSVKDNNLPYTLDPLYTKYKMVIDEICCGRWLHLFRRRPGEGKTVGCFITVMNMKAVLTLSRRAVLGEDSKGCL